MLHLTATFLLATCLLHGQDRHVMDGRFEDWVNVPVGVDDDGKGLIRAIRVADDPHFVYLQIDLDRPRTLQGLDEELRIELDFDDSDSTGFEGFSGLQGVDWIVAFSPLDEKKSTARSGSALIGTDSTGKRINVPISPELGVVALPTHGGERFEIRFNRLPEFRRNAFQAQVIARNANGATDQTTILDYDFKTDSTTKPLEVIHDPAEATAANSFRVMSWNGERGALLNNSDPFGRTFQALLPDIVLLQELPANDETPTLNKVKELFDRLEGDKTWSGAISGQQFRVGILTPHPFQEVEELQDVRAAPPGGRMRQVRAVGGLVTIEGARILAVSVHLKCCGKLGSTEDDKREREVEAIHEAVRLAVRRLKPDSVLIGGDLNLVGTPKVLDRLCEGLAPDGGNLIVAEPIRPAGDATTTWEKAGQAFVPGKLDFILASSNTAIQRAVVLDTAQMSEEWRLEHSIPKKAPSDHLAITVDFALPETPVK